MYQCINESPIGDTSVITTRGGGKGCTQSGIRKGPAPSSNPLTLPFYIPFRQKRQVTERLFTLPRNPVSHKTKYSLSVSFSRERGTIKIHPCLISLKRPGQSGYLVKEARNKIVAIVPAHLRLERRNLVCHSRHQNSFKNARGTFIYFGGCS